MIDVMSAHAVEQSQIAKTFSLAAAHYDMAAKLQMRIGNTLWDYLAQWQLNPTIIIDLGSGTGQFTQRLANHYAGAQVIAFDIAQGMLMQCKQHQTTANIAQICGDASYLPFQPNTVDLIFSNLMLQWCNDGVAVFKELHRVLRPGGICLLTTFGAATLMELRRSWAQIDQYQHTNFFHPVSNFLRVLAIENWFIVLLKNKIYTQCYPDIYALMRELKTWGAHNMTQGRLRGLTGKYTLQRLQYQYETYRNAEGLLPASYEAIYIIIQKPNENG